MASGGTLIAIGRSANIGHYFGLPIADALVETVNGSPRRPTTEKLYVPGSVLQASIDPSLPLTCGLPEKSMCSIETIPFTGCCPTPR